MKNENEIADCIVAWMTLLGILFGVCMLGLVMALLKGVLLMFGIESNL